MYICVCSSTYKKSKLKKIQWEHYISHSYSQHNKPDYVQFLVKYHGCHDVGSYNLVGENRGEFLSQFQWINNIHLKHK